MYNVHDCIEAFHKLLDIEYQLILGRKNTTVSLEISFCKKDCFHLLGLQYLKDRPELKKDRGRVFDEIKQHRIEQKRIETSDFYSIIEKRINIVPFLEDLFDSNDTIFKYNQKINKFSMITADYLMKNRMGNKNVFVFLSKNVGNKYFCRSLFPEDKKDYSKNQASWTLLYKKKVNVSTGEEIVLYDRLNS